MDGSAHRARTATRPLTLTLVLLLGLLAAAPAQAARSLAGVPDGLGETAASQNFLVHYTSAAGSPDAITADAAQALLQNLERALGDSRSRLELPPPLDDGDGRADIYVYGAAARLPEPGIVRADTRDDRTSGWIGLPPGSTSDIVAVTHMVVHLQQLALYRPAGRVLAEGTATWAPLNLYALTPALPDIAQFFPDDPVDCDDPGRCARPGYNAWRFFELLAERHGPAIVRDLYDRTAVLGSKDGRLHLGEALSEALAARGTTVPATFADFTAANLGGGYTLPGLARRRYGATEPFGDLATGTRVRRLRRRGVTLDHLSSAFYRVRSGSEDPSASRARCRRVRLRITLTGPRDLGTPVYWQPFRPRRGKPRPLELTRGRAVLEIPWTTCGGREIGVAFPNPSTDVDDRTFRLAAAVEAKR